MRTPHLHHIAHPLASAAPVLRPSLRWPYRADEARVPASEPRPPAPIPTVDAPLRQTRRTEIRAMPERASPPAQAGPAAIAPDTRAMAAPQPEPAAGVRSPPSPLSAAAANTAERSPANVMPSSEILPDRIAIIPASARSPTRQFEPAPAPRATEPDRGEPEHALPRRVPDRAPSATEPHANSEPAFLTPQRPDPPPATIRPAAVQPQSDRQRAADDGQQRNSTWPRPESLFQVRAREAPKSEAQPALKIGTVEVRIVQPPAPSPTPAPVSAFSSASALSRGFGSLFGFRQG